MNKLFTIFFLICSFFLSKGNAEIVNLALPDKFNVTFNGSFLWTFQLSSYDKNSDLGIIIPFYHGYNYFDSNQKLLGKIVERENALEGFIDFDLYDQDEIFLGRFEINKKNANLIKIYSADGKLAARAVFNHFYTKGELKDSKTGQNMLKFYRSIFNTDWTLEFENKELFLQKDLDPRFLIFLMPVHTAKLLYRDW